MQIRIQLFTLIWIRIRIRIPERMWWGLFCTGTFGESCRRPCRECRTQHAVRNPASWCPPQDWFRLKYIKLCMTTSFVSRPRVSYKKKTGYKLNYVKSLNNHRKQVIPIESGTVNWIINKEALRIDHFGWMHIRFDDQKLIKIYNCSKNSGSASGSFWAS